MPYKFLRIAEVCARMGVCRATYYNKVDDGLWPKAVGSPRLRGELDSEVDEMLAAIVAGKSDDELRSLVRRLEAARTGQVEEKRPTAPAPTVKEKARTKPAARRASRQPAEA